jgi:hypothetical protein
VKTRTHFGLNRVVGHGIRTIHSSLNFRCKPVSSSSIIQSRPRVPTPQLPIEHHCDSTISEMRGLSPKIISGDSRRSENAQTHTNTHTIPNMKFKLKLLQIKYHVLGFTKDKAPKCASKDNQSFCGSVRLSHDRHTLFTLEESEPPRTTYTYESQ